MKSTDWLSERVLFGILMILGFIVLDGLGMLWPGLSTEQRQYGRDGLLVLGPIVGIIAQAIWKSDRTDKSTAESVASLSSAVNTMATPAVPVAVPPVDAPKIPPAVAVPQRAPGAAL